jgi:hypothetical protein
VAISNFVVPSGRASAWHNAYPVPSVNQMLTAGGAGYNAGPYYPKFPTSPMGRIQTPVRRVGAFLVHLGGIIPDADRNKGRGRMWCR